MHAKIPSFLILGLTLLTAPRVSGQSTAFTYQGRLTTNTNLANGNYDLLLMVYDAAIAGNVVAGPRTNSSVAVSNGLFVTTLDFGSAPFRGANRWLGIAVRLSGTGAFTTLSPRQRITSAPYAIQAANVADGAVTATKLSAGAGANGQVLKLGGSGLTWGADANSGGTVTSVAAGTGLSGGPITIAGTLAIDTNIVPRLAAANTFSAANTFNGVVSLANPMNQIVGSFNGNGTGLSNVTAATAVTAISFSGALAGDVTGTQGANTIARIRGVDVASTAPVANQFLRYNGSTWTPGAVALSTDVSGALPPFFGGSGQSTYAAGDLLYASAPNTLERRAIGSTSQVLTASNSLPVWADANAHNHFGQTWTGADADGLFVQNTSTNASVSAVTGSAMGTTAINYGVFGQSASKNGTGVQGTAYSTVGTTAGVSGQADSPSGAGVYGFTSATTGTPTGLYGESVSTDGIGVYGIGSATSGVAVGVYGETFSLEGYGLYTPNKLYVGDTAFLEGHLSLSDGARLFVGAGSNAAPSISFTASPNAGMLSPAVNVLALVTAGAERVRIAADGKVGLGRVPAANVLEVAGTASKTTSGNWLANSDARIKTNVQNLEHALDTVDRIRPVSFRYTEEYRRDHPGIEDMTYYNVIAQDFAKVFPDAVKSSGEMLDGKPILQVDTYPATIHSIAAIQELHRLVETQGSELAKLREQNAKLEKRLATFEKMAAALTQQAANP
jgi:hypothetical protein